MRAIDRLFDRLVAEFGHKFASAIPNAEAEQSAKAVWAERLAGLTLAELKHGVARLAEYSQRHAGWPPGAAEFRKLCRPPRAPYERTEFQGRVLPQAPADRACAQRHLAELKQMLGMT
jgi:hypothetical protein